MMKKYIYSIVLALAGFMPVNAQLSFTVSGEYFGNCGGHKNEIQNRYNSIISQYKTQATGIRTIAECEKLRAEINGISYNYNTKGFNCGFRLKAGPCTGRPMNEHVISLGQVNIQGPEQGGSFFSTNGADEINNWSEDDMKRRLALDKNSYSSDPTNVSTGDSEFDEARKNYDFTGRMPAGSISLIKKEKLTPRPGNSSVPYIGDGVFKGIQKPISSPDLSTDALNSFTPGAVNIDLRSDAILYDSNVKKEKSSIWSQMFNSLDNSLDYYNALEQGDANFLQYMYTRWGKENVMEGIYWWEKNNMSDRIINAYNSIQDAVANTVLHPIDTYNNLRDGAIEKIKDNVDVGVGSTIRFLLPPQYKETGERAQAIYDTAKGIIPDMLNTVKEAPGMIDRGETIDITQTLGKANDRVQGLAASYGSSEMSIAYSKLKSAADINNLPQEKQKKGLLDMFKKEGKGMVKSEIKDSGYYKKMEKNSKKILDPFNFIFD